MAGLKTSMVTPGCLGQGWTFSIRVLYTFYMSMEIYGGLFGFKRFGQPEFALERPLAAAQFEVQKGCSVQPLGAPF